MNRSHRLEHPFWPTLLVSGSLAALALAACLVFWARSGQPRAFILAGLAGLVLGVHGVSWGQGRRGHFARGIWLVAAFQVLAAVLVSLLVSDTWIIGLLLMVVVPMEIAVADRLDRMPVAIVFSLLGAAALLSIDLAEPAGRSAIFSELAYTKILAAGFLALHLAGLGFLLWRFRLDPKSNFHTRLDLATQQTLVLTLIATGSIILVTGVLIAQIRASQIQQVGQSFQTLAQINAERVGNSLEEQVRILLSLSRGGSALIDGLEAANAGYPQAIEEIEGLLSERELLWQVSGEGTDFILRYRSNPQTQELSKFRGAALLHNNLFLTDRYGGLVAAQGEKPARFQYNQLDWWKAAWNDSLGGVFLGYLKVDAETGAASLFMAVGVLNPRTNRITGVLASTFELSSLQLQIGSAKTLSAGHVHLIAPDGIVIAGPDPAEFGRSAWPGLLNSGILPRSEDSRPSKPGVLLGQDSQERPAVLAYAPLNTTSGIDLEALASLGWQVVVSDTQDNALLGMARSTKVASLAGVVAIILVVLAAIGIARILTRPIEDLTTVATAIAAGQLSQRAEPVGPVEMVTLAEAFNSLTAQLRSLINSLQDQVSQRTAQLEARANQLDTLNRITQAVASVTDLKAALDIVAYEMVLLFKVRNTSIALITEDRSMLKIVADYAQSNEYPSAIGISIPVTGNLSSEYVLETAHPIVVPDPQTHPLTESIHALMRERRTECLMIVPLLARGVVIGTIGLSSIEPGRVFTEGEVDLAETIAGQIAGAIDNARLFTETLNARQAAEAANQAKSDFLANISHELRTPLTSVLGFARIIQKRLQERIFPALQSAASHPDPRLKRAMDQVEDNIDIIITEGERLTILINDVLDLAKIEAGKVEWQVQRLAIGEVFERAIASSSALFEGNRLALIRDIPDGMPEVEGDRNRLIQVIINLLSNAVKFTRQGSVTCRVRYNEASLPAGRRASSEGGEIVVSIIDTGIGIAPADQPRVFEKFTQVGDTLTDKPRGTGLGLPICKEIVERHRGRIWVESSLGQGSTFSFSLPVVSREAKETGNPVSAGAGEFKRTDH